MKAAVDMALEGEGAARGVEGNQSRAHAPVSGARLSFIHGSLWRPHAYSHTSWAMTSRAATTARHPSDSRPNDTPPSR